MSQKRRGAGADSQWWKTKIINRSSRGVFRSSEWIEAGDGLLASAKVLRQELSNKREELFLIGQRRGQPSKSQMDELMGIPGSSFLLIGYAVETYLKACLVCVCEKCPEDMVGREFKKFSHKLRKLAEEVEFPFLEAEVDLHSIECSAQSQLVRSGAITDRDAFELLTRVVTGDGRYPLTPNEERCVDSYVMSWNQRSMNVNNEALFLNLSKLAERVREHAMALKGTARDPLCSRAIPLEPDGYVVFRAGGNLRPRITIKLESTMWRDKSSELASLHQFFVEEGVGYSELLNIWDRAIFRFDADKKSGLVENWAEYCTSTKARESPA